MVVQLGLNPLQVLDEMQMYEILPLIEHAYLKSKDQWEMTRLQSYLTVSSQCKINKPMTDFIPFFWEKEEKESHFIDKESIKRLKEEIKQREKSLNGYIKK